MSARDDYPYMAGCVTNTSLNDEIIAALDEIDRLRAELAAHTTPRCPTCHQQCDRTRCDCGPDCDTAEHQAATT